MQREADRLMTGRSIPIGDLLLGKRFEDSAEAWIDSCFRVESEPWTRHAAGNSFRKGDAMSVTMEAIVENGLLRTLKPLSFSEQERVVLTIDSIDAERSANGNQPHHRESEVPRQPEDDGESHWRGVFVVDVPCSSLPVQNRASLKIAPPITPDIHIILDPRYFDDPED